MNESATLDRPAPYSVMPRYTEVDMLVEERRILLQEVETLRSTIKVKQARAAHIQRKIDSKPLNR